MQRGVRKIVVRKIFQSLATLLPAIFLGLLCIKIDAIVAVVFLVRTQESRSYIFRSLG